MFHINTCSLSKNFDDLEYLLKTINMNLDIIAISEARITKIIYVANHLAYKPRTDLQIYKKRDSESTFIKIVTSEMSNMIIGCIYRHNNMDLNDFNNDNSFPNG